MITTIPYEDVQIAATQLMQCATNILSVRDFSYTGKNLS
jgi:hypothetical protein